MWATGPGHHVPLFELRAAPTLSNFAAGPVALADGVSGIPPTMAGRNWLGHGPQRGQPIQKSEEDSELDRSTQ